MSYPNKFVAVFYTPLTGVISVPATKILSNNYGSVRRLIDESLSKFKFSYVDLLLIHDPTCGPKNRIKMWKDLLKARDAGKAKTVGVSNL